MGAIRLIVAPFRRIANSRVFQLALVIAIILSLDHYSYDYAMLGPIADGLKGLVTATVQLCSNSGLPGVAAAGANQTQTDPAGQVGRDLCVAPGQPTAVPTTASSDCARCGNLRVDAWRRRRSGPAFYAIPGFDLDRPPDRVSLKTSLGEWRSNRAVARSCETCET